MLQSYRALVESIEQQPAIEVDDDLAKQSPFTELGRTVTQKDFPAIVAAIREQNRAEFGGGSDRPE